MSERGFREEWILPCKSQEFMEGPVLKHERSDLRIGYDCESLSGEYFWEDIIFTGVAAFRFTSHKARIPEHLAAYDRLLVAADSEWIASFSSDSRLRHWRIYFDEIGCYEVLGTGFVPPT